MTILPLEHLLPSLRARWRVLAFTWLAVVALVLAVSLALPRRYEATSAVAVEMTGTDPIRGQAVFKPAGAVSTYIATQADIIRSEEVARGVLHTLGLEKQKRWRDKWQKSAGGQGDFESWLAGQLLRQLDVRPSRDSNVLTLAYSSDDAAFAAAAANAFVQSFIDVTVQMQAAPARRFNSFFAERAKGLRQELDQARARLSAYERKHGLVIGEDPDVESGRLAELNSQLVTLQDSAAEAANSREQAKAAPDEIREIRNDPEVAVLTGELIRNEGQLAELKSQFGERHQAVIQARQSVADVKQRLGAARGRAAESLGASSKVIEARVAGVRAAIERQREVVLQRKSERDAASALLGDVESAQKAYATVLNRASQTALESANTTQTSVSVLKSATAPIWSAASLVRNLVVAALLGLLLGVARALFAEARDRRLRNIGDITHLLRQPLLLALPDAQSRRREAMWRAEQTHKRLVAAQPRLPFLT